MREKRIGRAGGETVALLVVRDGRHPLVLLLLVGAMVSGVIGLIGPANPQSVVDKLVPEPWRMAYYVLLGLSGLVTMVGVWLPDLRDRLAVEQIGLWFLSGTLLVYPVAIAAFYPGKLGFGGVISCLFGLGGLWRILEIILEVRRWHRAMKRG